MIDLVTLAEDYLKQQGAWELEKKQPTVFSQPISQSLANLRAEVSQIAGFSVILNRKTDNQSLNFAQRPDLALISQQGPATPDHVIRTKRIPQIGRDVQAYAQAYQTYFNTESAKTKDPKTMLDAAPRVILDPELGLCTVGQTTKSAAIASDIYQHTIEIIERATQLGGYQALSATDIFEVEYWDLEQAKLRTGGNSPIFTGEVALVTGGASGIGKACVESLLKRGTAVIALDIQPEIEFLHERVDFCGIQCDLTDETAFNQALTKGIETFGGLDILVLNAGIFPPSCRVADLSQAQWQRVMNLNLDTNLMLLRECYPFLKLAFKGGRVVVIGSKNVTAPGPGVAAYSVSKAALNQLIRVTALEWGRDRIRLNTLHPNAVFDTGIWTEEVLTARAKHYGLSIEDYKTNNLLKVEITSRDVAELAAEMCGPLFSKTTAAQLPIDGGNERVI